MAKLSPRQTRWLNRLQEFDLVITHIPWSTNVVADILIRMHDDSTSLTEATTIPKLNIVG